MMSSTRALRERVGDSNVAFAIDAQRDRYGRALGVCSIHGEDLNGWCRRAMRWRTGATA